MRISTTGDACGGGSNGCTLAGITGQSSKAERQIEIEPCPHRRSRNPARLLCENPDTSRRRRCCFHAPRIRQLGMGGGHCSHLGGSGAASSADCRHSRPRHHLRHGVRWTAGQCRPDQQRSPRLRSDAHLSAALCESLGGPQVLAQDGKLVRPDRRLGDRPDAQSPLQRTGSHGVPGRPCRHADAKVHHGADGGQCTNRLCRSPPSVPAGPISQSWRSSRAMSCPSCCSPSRCIVMRLRRS